MKAVAPRAQSLISPADRRRWIWAPVGPTVSSIANLVLYQIGWFACVLGAANGWGAGGAIVAVVLAAVHLALSGRPDREWPLLLAAMAAGLVVDTIHAGVGVLDFRGHAAGAPAPLWILGLWLQFGTVLHFSMRWLSKRYLLASILGLIGGPMSFLAGERLGAAAFGEPRALSLAVLGISWSIALPALVAFADRLTDGLKEPGRYRIFVPRPERPSLSDGSCGGAVVIEAGS